MACSPRPTEVGVELPVEVGLAIDDAVVDVGDARDVTGDDAAAGETPLSARCAGGPLKSRPLVGLGVLDLVVRRRRAPQKARRKGEGTDAVVGQAIGPSPGEPGHQRRKPRPGTVMVAFVAPGAVPDDVPGEVGDVVGGALFVVVDPGFADAVVGDEVGFGLAAFAGGVLLSATPCLRASSRSTKAFTASLVRGTFSTVVMRATSRTVAAPMYSFIKSLSSTCSSALLLFLFLDT